MLYGRVIFIIFALSFSHFTYAGNFYVSPNIGRGEITVNSNYSFQNSRDVDYNFGRGLTLGKEFDSHFIVEANYFQAETDSIFSISDSYQLNQERIFIGYSFDVSSSFRFIPKLGYSRWELKSEEGVFLNPGPEERKSIEGNKTFIQLEFDFPINSWLSINASYSNASFDFGKAQSLNAGVKFSF